MIIFKNIIFKFTPDLSTIDLDMGTTGKGTLSFEIESTNCSFQRRTYQLRGIVELMVYLERIDENGKVIPFNIRPVMIDPQLTEMLFASAFCCALKIHQNKETIINIEAISFPDDNIWNLHCHSYDNVFSQIKKQLNELGY